MYTKSDQSCTCETRWLRAPFAARGTFVSRNSSSSVAAAPKSIEEFDWPVQFAMRAATPLDAGSAAEPSSGKSGWGSLRLSEEMVWERLETTAAMMEKTVSSESGAEVDGGTDVEELSVRTEKEGVSSSISACSRVPNSQLQRVGQHEASTTSTLRCSGLGGSGNGGTENGGHTFAMRLERGVGRRSPLAPPSSSNSTARALRTPSMTSIPPPTHSQAGTA